MIINKIKYLFIVLLLASVLMPVQAFPQNNSGVVIQKNQQDPNRAREQLAMSYYRNKEFDKALLIYEELYNSSQKQYYYSYYLNCLIYLKEYKDADKLVRKQLKAQPGNIRLIIDQIYVYDLLENTRKSEKMMADLLNDLPMDKSQVIQVASALEAKGYFDEALEVYN